MLSKRLLLISFFLAANGCGILSDNVPPAEPKLANSELRMLQAFTDHIHPFLTKNCTGCHDQAQTPRFLYAQPIPTMKFLMDGAFMEPLANPTAALIVRKANDGHCGDQLKCVGRGPELAAHIGKFYESNAKRGDLSSFRIVTTNHTLIAPPMDPAWQTLSWKFPEEFSAHVPADLKASMAGAKMEIEVQRFNEITYRFRKPRLTAGTNSIYLNGLKVILNGAYNTANSQYAAVERTIAANQAPILAPNLMLMNMELPDEDYVAIAFDEMMPAPALACKNVASFVAKVKPFITHLPAAIPDSTRCLNCHNQNHVRFPMQFPGGALLDDDTLCLRALMRVDLAVPTSSTLIQNPAAQANGHPARALRRSEYIDQIVEWIVNEQ